MISTKFSVVENVLKFDGGLYNYDADPTVTFNLTFNGEHIYNIEGDSLEALYGRLLMCWMEGVNSFYMILKTNRLVQIDKEDYTLCRYLATEWETIRGLDDLEVIRAFAHL